MLDYDKIVEKAPKKIMEKGKLTLIGARAGTGKTAMAAVLLKQALYQDSSVLFASADLDNREVIGKILHSIDPELSKKIKNSIELTEEEKVNLKQILSSIKFSKISIMGRYVNYESIIEMMRMLSKDLDLVIIDHLMVAGGKHSEKFEEAIENLKLAAIRYNVPVIAFFQRTNFAIANRENMELIELKARNKNVDLMLSFE